jgi:hypothetical protein
MKGQASSLILSDSVDVSSIRHEEVEVVTLDDVLEQAGNPKIDYLSIDVEGHDLKVLQGFDIQRHRPQLIVIEDDFNNRLQIYSYLKQRGYRLVKRTGCNNWYIPRDQSFSQTTFWERIMLFRKMFLSTPIRQLKAALTGEKAR